MDLATLAPTLLTIYHELVQGSPDPRWRTYMLNQGDPGLLESLDRLSAAAASARHGGPTIAAHVDHLRYGLAMLNRWAAGHPASPPELDWTASWKVTSVSEAEWQTLRAELRREAEAWAEAIRTRREVSDIEAGWVAGSVSHIAYHLGAIRQIDRAARGPSAEDEARVPAEYRMP